MALHISIYFPLILCAPVQHSSLLVDVIYKLEVKVEPCNILVQYSVMIEKSLKLV